MSHGRHCVGCGVWVTDGWPIPHDCPKTFYKVYESEIKRMTEQPLPKPGGRPVTPEVRRLLDEREAKGIATYGATLSINNGRSFLQDLTEELADGLQYAVGLRMELEEILELLEGVSGVMWEESVSEATDKLRTFLGKGRG